MVIEEMRCILYNRMRMRFQIDSKKEIVYKNCLWGDILCVAFDRSVKFLLMSSLYWVSQKKKYGVAN